MRFRRSVAASVVMILVVAACTSDEPTAESVCLDAVGEIQVVVQTYQELLESGVEQMRDDDAVEKLRSVSDRYSELLDELNERESTVPAEVRRSHDLLAGGVGMQASAWRSVSDGVRFRDPDLIDDGAELIELSRQLVEESALATPDCSATDN